MGTTRLEAGSRSARLRFSQRSAPVRIRVTVTTARRLIRSLGGPAGRARRLVTPRFLYRRIPPGIFGEDFVSRADAVCRCDESVSDIVAHAAQDLRVFRFSKEHAERELDESCKEPGDWPKRELAAAMGRRNKDHARDITPRREISNRAPERKICGDLTEMCCGLLRQSGKLCSLRVRAARIARYPSLTCAYHTRLWNLTKRDDPYGFQE